MTPLKIEELKTDYWYNLAKEKFQPILRYDDALDTFFVYLSPKETDRIITHFIDDCVAFLYRQSDKEVVGIKVEYFKKRFLPTYANKNWRLSKTGIKLEGIDDFMFKIEWSKTSPINSRTIPTRPIESKVHPVPVFAGMER